MICKSYALAAVSFDFGIKSRHSFSVCLRGQYKFQHKFLLLHLKNIYILRDRQTDSRSRPFDTHFYFFGLHKKSDFLADSNSDDISNPAYSIEDMQYPSYDCGHCYGKRDYVQDKRN